MASSASDAQSITIRFAGEADVGDIASLWHDFYREQREWGLRLDIPDDGFDKWTDFVRSGLGRLICLLLVLQDDNPIGFLTGQVRVMPPYYGGHPIGFITEVYIERGSRNKGAGTKLVEAARQWFTSQGISRLEMDCIPGNIAARKMYNRLGWTEELARLILM